jgi:hypothetical protein
MYERVSNPGLLYFNVNGESDSDIENVKCTVEGYPGTCHLYCITRSNDAPQFPGPFDGYEYVFALRITW